MTTERMPEERVTLALLEMAAGLPREFKREEAGAVLETMGLSPADRDAALQALKRMPGVETVRPGRYRMPRNKDAWINARLWRFTMPRLNAATAVQVLRELERAPAEDLDPDLYALTGRLKRALKGIGVRAGDLE